MSTPLVTDVASSRAPLALARVASCGEALWTVRRGEVYSPLGMSLSELLRLPRAQARSAVEAADAGGVYPDAVLAPVDPQQEIWGAGVTYRRSRDGRKEESDDGSLYDRVYAAERPELFFKSVGARVVDPGTAIGVRADSSWNVPEPELGAVLDASGALFGYVPGNDASSRSIEGENPLYLPQAKTYTASTALGPEIVPEWLIDGPFAVSVDITRGGIRVFHGATSTGKMARSLGELADWLFRALDFPDGVILLTGTGIVPGADFTLLPGAEVSITIAGLGTLVNPVERVGRERARERAQEEEAG